MHTLYDILSCMSISTIYVFVFCDVGRYMSAKLTGTSQAKESEELKNYSLTLETPIGLLKITANDKAIIAIKPIEVEKNRLLSEDANELVKKCAQELKEYLAGQCV